ncbi:MAG: TolC family protein [Ignavibacteriae bacterium]|nr:TolC family protein [Ignavibacteria bacterium]MBI3365520.1 TolC family protein [Ignavibacteriota bacterium]
MIRTRYCLLLLYTFVNTLAAQPLGDSLQLFPIDLSTVLKLAGANNLEIQLAEQKVEAAHAQSLSANEKYLPTFTPGIFYLQHNNRLQATDGTFLFVNKHSILGGVKGEVSWELRDAIFQSLAAHQRSNASEFAYEATTNDMLLQAVNQYYDLLQAKQAEKVAEESATLFKELGKEIEHKVNVGLGSPSDLYLVRAEEAHARVLFEQAREQSDLASLRLAQTLRLDPMVTLVPADSQLVEVTIIPKDSSARALVESARSRRPELLSSQSLLSAATSEKNAAIWGPLIPLIKATVAGGGFGPEFGDLKNSNDIGLALQWSIGPGGLFDFGRGKFASALQRTSELQVEKAHDQITTDVLSAYTRVQTKSRQLVATKQGLKDIQQAVKLAQERQRTGIGIALEVVQALKTYYTAEKDYVEAVGGYNKAQYELYRAIGVPIEAR